MAITTQRDWIRATSSTSRPSTRSFVNTTTDADIPAVRFPPSWQTGSDAMPRLCEVFFCHVLPSTRTGRVRQGSAATAIDPRRAIEAGNSRQVGP
jgi:hypothetical protein